MSPPYVLILMTWRADTQMDPALPPVDRLYAFTTTSYPICHIRTASTRPIWSPRYNVPFACSNGRL